MNTGDAHALSGAYALDALEGPERERFEEHLAGCPECQAEVRSLRETAALLADDSAIAPPASLRDQVLSGISAIRPMPPEVEPASEPEAEPVVEPASEPEAEPVVELASRSPRRPGRRRALLAAAAAAVIALGGAVAITQPWQDEPGQSELTATDRVLAAADARRSSITLGGGAKATVVHSASLAKAVLVTAKMPAAPEGKVYEVWLQNPAGAMLPAGLMSGAGDQKLLLDGDPNQATAVGITVEPAGGSPAPTTEPVAVIELETGTA